MSVWQYTQALKHRRAAAIVTCVVSAWLVVACADIRLYGPCGVPKQLHEGDLTGGWQLTYANFLTEPSSILMNGDETLFLYEDGVYAHTFISSEYAYRDGGNTWEFILDAPDSPKLKMNGMKYFADGIERATPDKPFNLSPQMPDSFRVQDYNKDKKGDQWVRSGLDYPTDGFIYLYPRLCDGELALVQMMDPRQDPDDMTVQNPVFRRPMTVLVRNRPALADSIQMDARDVPK